jgi:hypothetical protein
MDVSLAFLGWFFGALATIATTIWVERLRNPLLKSSIAPPQSFSARGPFKSQWRSLRIAVANEPLARWARWLTRLPAQQCRAEIAFLRADGTDYFDVPMKGRWIDTPEPRVALVGTANGQVAVLTNSQELKPTVDIYPGESELLDVAIRVDGEDPCYGWNDEAYFHAWRNPERKLEKHVYLVKVTVTSSGKKRTDYFRLLNDGPFAAFRLAQLTPTDQKAVSARNQA